MRVVFAGTPETAIPTLRALVQAGHEVVSVLTRADAPVGRKALLTPSPVAVAALELNIPVIKANQVDEEVAEQVNTLNSDIGIVVAYGAFLPAIALTATTHGWLNLHFSDLPKHRGAAPIQWTLIQGEDHAATCVFKLVSTMDAGPIASTEFTELLGHETTGDLLHSLSQSGALQVVKTVSDIANGTVAFAAQQGEPTFAPKLTSASGQLLETDSALTNFNKYRGVTPEPGAWIADDESRLKIHEARLSNVDVPHGTISIVDGAVLWGTKTTALELVVVQPAGRQRMNAEDWARGRR